MPNDRITGDMVFKLSSRKSPSEVNLKSFEWAIVTQLNGEKSVDQIGEILALDPVETIEMFERLQTEGLLEGVTVSRSDPYVSGDLLQQIETDFTFFVGPVASILIEDLLAEFKRNKNNLDKNSLPLFVEMLTLEIRSDEKKHEFQKKMLEKIKGLY